MRHSGAQIEEVSLVVSLETLVLPDQNFPDQSQTMEHLDLVLADQRVVLGQQEKLNDLVTILIRHYL